MKAQKISQEVTLMNLKKEEKMSQRKRQQFQTLKCKYIKKSFSTCRLKLDIETMSMVFSGKVQVEIRTLSELLLIFFKNLIQNSNSWVTKED